MRLRARMLTCQQRAAVRAETLASWQETDWGDDVRVQLDESRHENVFRRMEETWLALLKATVEDETCDFALLLEDDLAFNRFLRHNLESWQPLLASGGGTRPFFGSLYRCGQPMLWRNDDTRYLLAAPEGVWGAQAVVVSRATARHLLPHWTPGIGAHDLQMARLAGQIGPIYYHLPSLVQHRQVASTWRPGAFHHADDFDPQFRAPA